MNRQKQLSMIAREIADRIDDELIVDITLSGSVSRGNADPYSDIELDFWCEKSLKKIAKSILNHS